MANLAVESQTRAKSAVIKVRRRPIKRKCGPAALAAPGLASLPCLSLRPTHLARCCRRTSLEGNPQSVDPPRDNNRVADGDHSPRRADWTAPASRRLRRRRSRRPTRSLGQGRNEGSESPLSWTAPYLSVLPVLGVPAFRRSLRPLPPSPRSVLASPPSRPSPNMPFCYPGPGNECAVGGSTLSLSSR